ALLGISYESSKTENIVASDLLLSPQSDQPAKHPALYKRNNPVKTIDVAIVCALKEPELKMLLRAMKEHGKIEWGDMRVENDPHSYFMTELFSKKNRPIQVIASSPTQKGMTATAILTTKIILQFQPKLVIMVGIAAGTKAKDRNFGDILAAEISFDY